VAEVFVVPAFCDNCGAPMESGVAPGVARSELPPGHPAFPCPTCFLGTGRVVDGGYSALLEGARVLRHATPEGTARLCDLLERHAADGGRPSPYQLHPFPPDSAERRLLDMIPWARPDVRALLSVLVTMFRWWLAPDAPVPLPEHLNGSDDPDAATQRMVQAYVSAHLHQPVHAVVAAGEDDEEEPASSGGDERPVEPVDGAEAVDRAEAVAGGAGEPPGPSANGDGATRVARTGAPAKVVAEVRSSRIGRNQPCPCGSGKKRKHCHG
jgi:hypothetical protein